MNKNSNHAENKYITTIEEELSVAKKQIQFYQQELENLKNDKYQEILQKEHHQLELAICNGKLGTWEWNIAQESITIQDKWNNIFGHQWDNFCSDLSFFHTLIHPDDLRNFNKSFNDLLLGNNLYREISIRILNKKKVWV